MECALRDNGSSPQLWLYDISRAHADFSAQAGLMKMREFSVVMRTNILATLLDTPPDTLKFSKGANGKPHLEDNNGLNFSVSHTGTLWAMALVFDGVQIGLDIERARPRKYMSEIMKTYFHPRECQHYFGLADEQSRRAYFYKLWTQKEACAKYWGLGLDYNFSKDCFNDRYPDDLKLILGRVTDNNPRADDIYLSLASSLHFKSQDVVSNGDQSLYVSFIDSLER